jgi:hypothetical protein
MFVATGHAGQIRVVTEAAEEEALDDTSGRPPSGWEVVADHEQSGPRDYRW